MGLELNYTEGQTPIDEDEKDGLLIQSISTRSELDEFEQQNIENAFQWMLSRSFKATSIFSKDFVCLVHKKMFGDVWAWAGDFRKTNKNIGVDKWQIPSELRYLLDDILYWIENKTYPPDEITIRFKHRLVSIHCFPNGNGRHSRLLADILNEKVFKRPAFTWGFRTIKAEKARALYLNCLRMADRGDYQSLIEFARS